MALGDIKAFDINTADLQLKVYVVDNDDGTVTIDVQWVGGSGDINALYWGDSTAEGGKGSQYVIPNFSSAVQMNGVSTDFDGGVGISNPGSSADVNVLDKEGFLSEDGESLHRTVTADFDAIYTFGVRATSTGDYQEGSVKGTDGEPEFIPAPKVSINDVCVYEEEGAVAKFTVSLEGGETYPYDVKVNYQTADGTAEAGKDYTETSGYVTIPAGETTACIEVPILNDDCPEDKEAFTVNLTSASADIPGPDIAVTLCDPIGVGDIKDTDVKEEEPPSPANNFPDLPNDLSNAVFYFGPLGDADGDARGEPDQGNSNQPDGVYAVKVDFDPDNVVGSDLDAYMVDLMGDIIQFDTNITADTTLLGVHIHAGGGQNLTYYVAGGIQNGEIVGTAAGDVATTQVIQQVDANIFANLIDPTDVVTDNEADSQLSYNVQTGALTVDV